MISYHPTTLAYIYDPNDSNTPQYLREGIQAILDNPEAEKSVKIISSVKLWKVAERNGGVNALLRYFRFALEQELQRSIRLIPSRPR